MLDILQTVSILALTTMSMVIAVENQKLRKKIEDLKIDVDGYVKINKPTKSQEINKVGTWKK